MKTQLIKISQIVVDEELYPRNFVDHNLAVRYEDAMNSGAQFPPITLAKIGKGFTLVDGRHRLTAVGMRNEKVISAEVLENLERKDIFREAVIRNISHGSSLNYDDRERSVKALLKFGFKKDEILEIVRMSIEKCEKYFSANVTRTIQTGTSSKRGSVYGISKNDKKQPLDMYHQENLATLSSIKWQIQTLRNLIEKLDHNWMETDNLEIRQLLQTLAKKLEKYRA